MKKRNYLNGILKPDTNMRLNPLAPSESSFYGHYRITYLIRPDGNIDILGVFHGALDIDRYLV